MIQDETLTPVILYSALILQGAGLANMLNTSTGLVSEMIGQDDAASAIVFALFNILESFASGMVVFEIMAWSLVDSDISLRILMSIIPMICAFIAYFISKLRF